MKTTIKPVSPQLDTNRLAEAAITMAVHQGTYLTVAYMRTLAEMFEEDDNPTLQLIRKEQEKYDELLGN